MRILPLTLCLFMAAFPTIRAEEGGTSAAVPVDLTVETLRVGEGGTETLSTDQARVFLGKGALLVRDVTLAGKSSLRQPVTEKLRVRAELRIAGVTETRLALTLKSRVQVLALSGGGHLPRGDITRAVTLEVNRGASELVTIYESASLDTKVTLNVKWGLADESEEAGVETTPIQLIARVLEVGESGENLLADNLLLALVGHRASTTFDRLVPLPGGGGDKKVRQDQMEIFLTPRFLSGRTLSISLEVSGEVVTLTAQGDYSHPLAHQGNYLLTPGGPVSAVVEVRSDSEEKEGWNRMRFRLEVAAIF